MARLCLEWRGACSGTTCAGARGSKRATSHCGWELGLRWRRAWIRPVRLVDTRQFAVRDEVIPVAPWIGYAWFALCGIGWGAPGGIILGWALHKRVSVAAWSVRALLFLALLALLFVSPLVDWLGEQFLRTCPSLLFPNAGLGIYEGDLDNHLMRTVYTNTQNFAVVVWWGIALIVAAIQRTRLRSQRAPRLAVGSGWGFR